MKSSDTGVILFAHGSRDPLWRDPMDAVATRLGEIAPETPVACAFLEITPPDLPQAVHQMLVRHMLRNIRIVPLFLGAGRHARDDLNALLTQLRATFPQTGFECLPPVGEDPRLTDLLARLALP